MSIKEMKHRLSAFVSAQSIFFVRPVLAVYPCVLNDIACVTGGFRSPYQKWQRAEKRATEPKQAATQAKDINIDIFSTVL